MKKVNTFIQHQLPTIVVSMDIRLKRSLTQILTAEVKKYMKSMY